jgi:hypothetical protein
VNVEQYDSEAVNSILAVYARATEAQRHAGRQWYPLARHVVDSIAVATESDPERVCMALAALSPRNPWKWNVADTYSFAVARSEGRTMPRATTFKRNQLRAWKALDLDSTDDPWTGVAPKVRAFVKAIMGDSEAVVVDTWAYRVARGVAPKRSGSFAEREYAPLAAAYKAAAQLVGESPRAIQAITWLVAQTEGLATSRRGRHDETFKAGTPDFVRSLLDDRQFELGG